MDCGRGLWYSVKKLMQLQFLFLAWWQKRHVATILYLGGLSQLGEIYRRVQALVCTPTHLHALLQRHHLVESILPSSFQYRPVSVERHYQFLSYQCAIQRATNSHSTPIITNGGVRIRLNRAIFNHFTAQLRSQTKILDTVCSGGFIKIS